MIKNYEEPTFPGDLMATWHHTYNGIPTVRTNYDSDTAGAAFYGDHVSNGHDHLSSDLLSGELSVKITVASPAVPGQQTREGRVVVASRSGSPNGAKSWDDATIPVSTLKGVLSSAYEAVTASRMRVFGSHDHVLTHRRTTQESTVLYPVMLVPGQLATDPGSTGLRVRVMLGENPIPRPGEWSRPDYVCAAVLPDSLASATAFYDTSISSTPIYRGAAKKTRRTGEPDEAEERLRALRHATPHLKEIEFTAEVEKFYGSQRVVVATIGDDRFCGTRGKPVCKVGRRVGYVVRLTPDSAEPLIDTKYNEFVFFGTPDNILYLDVPATVLDGLVEVIYSYLENVRLLRKQEKSRRDAGVADDSKVRRSDAPSTWLVDMIVKGQDGAPGLKADRNEIKEYLYQRALLSPGIPLFASVSQNGELTGLSVSQIGRRTGVDAVSPGELARAGRIAPARTFAEASPADRMWGFVADEKTDRGSQGASIRGRITIRPIEPVPPRDGAESWLRLAPSEDEGWILPVLASPKPSTGAPYLQTESGCALDERTTRAETFQSGQTLIRKTYPTHRQRVICRKPSLPCDTVPSDSPELGRTIVGSYLAPGASFRTTILFEGVTAEELAVLVWLLSPECLIPPRERRRRSRRFVVGYHHLGLGKPLGMGAVMIEATDIVVRNGLEMSHMYASLDGCCGCWPTEFREEPAKRRLADARKHLPAGFGSTLAVRAFRRSAFGWDGGAMEYPDASRHVEGDELSPIITWFQKREENRVKHKFDPNDVPLDDDYNLPGLV